jgi:hypothetical protein
MIPAALGGKINLRASLDPVAKLAWNAFELTIGMDASYPLPRR